MTITVYRPNQIGGCVTEIESDKGTRIIIDVGSELAGNKSGEIVKFEDITKDCTGVFITHYHGDHVGEFEKVDDDTPIFMGAAAHSIFLNVCESLSYVRDIDVDKAKRFITFQMKDEIVVGKERDIIVTPYRVDHSAFDSYMFLIECDGKKVLHTGDFRTHGWTGGHFYDVLKKYIGKVDALICEGTMLSRENGKIYRERDLYYEARRFFKKHKGKNVFILCSSTNIDSIASFYKAAIETGKLIIADGFQIKNMKLASVSAGSTLYKFPVIYPYRKDDQKCINDMRNWSEGFCMFVRAGGYLDGKNKFVSAMEEFPDSLFIYSMWDGYLEEKYRDPEIYTFVPKNALGDPDVTHMHTSGHAYEETIIDLCNTIDPEVILPIHGEKPDRFEKLKDENPDKIKGEISRFIKSGETKVI